MPSNNSSRILLIGGGHSHVQFLKNWQMDPLPGVELVMVSDVVSTPYSGMLPGRLAGWYGDREMHFNLAILCAQAGAVFIHDAVVGLSAAKKTAALATYPPLTFDVCSVNVGISPALPPGAAGNPRVIPVKPISQLLDRWHSLLEEADDSDQPWIVAGGGAAGFEVSLALAIAECRGNRCCNIQLLEAGPEILPGHSRAVRSRAEKVLQRWGVAVRVSTAVKKVNVQIAQVSSGADVTFERLLITTGGEAPGWFKNTDLKLSERGFAVVDTGLQCQPGVFAAGDCAHFASHPLKKSGVYAVRQGPVLIENIRAAAAGGRLRAYRPQRKTMAMLISGEKRALLSYGPIAAEGEWVWRWKDRIDRKFMQMFSPINVPMEPMAVNTCGGCGGKAPAQTIKELVTALGADPKFKDVGYVGDHAVTVDGFRTFTKDLNLFGRVSVLHAFNDLFASGSTPQGATVMVTLPPSAEKIRGNQLLHLMSGVMSVLKEHGAQLVNAHTAEGADVALSITAIGNSGKRWGKQALAPGQVLILTKPLGTGALLQARMQGKLAEDGERALTSSLLTSHGPWLAQNKVPVAACTDVSGFGLIGHLSEMMENMDVTLSRSAIRELPGFNSLEIEGVSAYLTAKNRAVYSALVAGEDPANQSSIYYDPQTNGPLLLAVDDRYSGDLLIELRASGFPHAQQIGFVQSCKNLISRIFVAE